MSSAKQRQPGVGSWEDAEPPALVALANSLAQQLQGLPRHGVTTENLRMLLTCCTPATLAATFRQLDSRNCGQRATDVFALLRRAPPGTSLASLCCAETYTAAISITPGSTRGVAAAQELLEEMRARGLPRSEAIYTNVMSLCVRAERLQDALAAFDALLEERLEPSLVTLHTLMDTYGQLRQWSNALVVLDAIASKGAGMVWTYNMAIIACGRGACAAEALTVLQRMLDAGLTPCLTTYTALMSLFCRAGELRSASRIFESMKAAGVAPNTITYSSLINGCDKANDLDAARFYFDEMLANGCQPSVVTYNTLLRACALPRAWRYALQLWHAMRQLGVKPDIVSVRAWLAAMHATGCWPAMLLVYLERLPRAVTKDPILQSKTCEALWSCGSEVSRAAALTLPGVRVAMSGAEHTTAPHGGGGVAVTSTWTTAASQPGPAAAALHSWLLSLLHNYSWPAHTHAVSCAVAAASKAAHAPPPPNAAFGSMPSANPVDGDALDSALRLSEDPRADGSSSAGGGGGFGDSRGRGRGRRADRYAPHSQWGGGVHHSAQHSWPTAMHPLRAHGGSGHDNVLHHAQTYSEPANALHNSRAGPAHRSPTGQGPRSPPAPVARAFCLCVDASHHPRMAAAIAECLEGAVSELQLPLRAAHSGAAVTLSCSHEQLAAWLNSEHTAGIVGEGAPAALESLRAQPAVLAALQHWIEQSSELQSMLQHEATLYPRAVATADRGAALRAALAAAAAPRQPPLGAAVACDAAQLVALVLSEGCSVEASGASSAAPAPRAAAPADLQGCVALTLSNERSTTDSSTQQNALTVASAETFDSGASNRYDATLPNATNALPSGDLATPAHHRTLHNFRKRGATWGLQPVAEYGEAWPSTAAPPGMSETVNRVTGSHGRSSSDSVSSASLSGASNAAAFSSASSNTAGSLGLPRASNSSNNANGSGGCNPLGGIAMAAAAAAANASHASNEGMPVSSEALTRLQRVSEEVVQASSPPPDAWGHWRLDASSYTNIAPPPPPLAPPPAGAVLRAGAAEGANDDVGRLAALMRSMQQLELDKPMDRESMWRFDAAAQAAAPQRSAAAEGGRGGVRGAKPPPPPPPPPPGQSPAEELAQLCIQAARGAGAISLAPLAGLQRASELAFEPKIPTPPISCSPSAWRLFGTYLALLRPAGPQSGKPYSKALTAFAERHLPPLATDADFATERPSLLAAAVMTCARRALSLAPEWPQALAGTTGHLLVQPPLTAGAAAARTPLHELCERVAQRCGLPAFEVSAYQQALADGLDGMMRPERRQNRLASTVTDEQLDAVLSKACRLAQQNACMGGPPAPPGQQVHPAQMPLSQPPGMPPQHMQPQQMHPPGMQSQHMHAPGMPPPLAKSHASQQVPLHQQVAMQQGSMYPPPLDPSKRTHSQLPPPQPPQQQQHWNHFMP